MILAEFRDVYKSYGSKSALAGLSFQLKKGELLALLGPNGAGKSTSLSLFMGLRSPDKGQVLVFGESPRKLSVRERVGATPQELGFPGLLTVQELLHMVQAHYPQKRDLSDLIQKLNLQKLLTRKAGGLSGGEKRRLGLAMALCGDPEVVFLDEPTTGMDIESRRELWGIIESLIKENRSIVLTTHYLEEVEALASRVIVVDHGKAMFNGTVDEIKAKVDLRKLSFISSIPVAKAQQWPGVVAAESKAMRLVLLTHDSDQLLHYLVQSQIEFRDLSIELSSLEEAFLHLRKNP